MSTKEMIIEMIKKLPAEATVADIIDELYFRQKVDNGLQQLDDGHGVPHTEAVQRLERWVK